MLNKSEESEWSRFSRALGGTPPPAPAPAPSETDARDEYEEPETIAQMPPAPSDPPETETFTPPPPPSEPEPVSASPPQASVDTSPLSAEIGRQQGLSTDETVIGEGAAIDGTVRSERTIRVRGSVQGEVESQQRVIVEEGARVQARITGESVTVLGEVSGAIVCTGRVEIASTARVNGEVSAATLVIQEGAIVEGNLKMAGAGAGGD